MNKYEVKTSTGEFKIVNADHYDHGCGSVEFYTQASPRAPSVKVFSLRSDLVDRVKLVYTPRGK